MIEIIRSAFETNRNLIQTLERTVWNFKRQNINAASRGGMEVFYALTDFMNNIYKIEEQKSCTIVPDKSYLNAMLSEIMNVQENGDYILLCDLYELKLIPFLEDIQQVLFEYIETEVPYQNGNYKENCNVVSGFDKGLGKQLLNTPFEPDNGKYSIEYSTNGEATAAYHDAETSVYLHSNHRPVEAAEILAESWFKEDKSVYFIYGLGLGYHAYMLGKMDETLEVIVFESDLQMIQRALQFGVLTEFLENPKHKVYYDPECKHLLEAMKNRSMDSELVVHMPSLQIMQDGPVKTKLENYFIQYSGIQNQIRLLNANFRENQKSINHNISELCSSWEGKTAYIVAAGPSLDKNFEHLKKVKEDAIIIAVGTVFRKMVKENIPVNYVIVSDANKRVLGQIRGVEEEKIPLLILSTAYHGFAEKYQGPVYQIYQNGFMQSEEAAKRNHSFTCEVGGSVTTVALDLCAKMGIKTVITIGLDLAYTDNFVHARDTSRRHISDIKHLRLCTDVNGEEVYTPPSFDKYREWIERWITKQNGMEFYNATEGGAFIKGMKHVKLLDVLDK